LETAGVENISLQTRNTKLHTFVKDLVEVISSHDNDGYHHLKYQNAVQNHQKLKDSILCMKELLSDTKSRLIRHEDRQSFYNIPRQIGYKNNLNFVDDSYVLETNIPSLKDFHKKNLLTQDALIKNLNRSMESFEKLEKETLPNTKKSVTESDKKMHQTVIKYLMRISVLSSIFF